MTYETLKIILCVLEKIEYKADLTLESTEEEIKERKRRKEELEKTMGEIERKEHKNKDMTVQVAALIGELFIPTQRNSLNFELLEGKKVCLYGKDIVECRINFEDDLKNLLKKFKEEYGIIIDFREVSKDKYGYYEIALPKDFNKRCKEIQNKLNKVLSKIKEKEVPKKEIIKEIGAKGETADVKKSEQMKIKHIRLDEDNCLLEINNGEKIISFKSKKKIKKYWDSENHLTKEQKEELKRETFKTKQFKILTELWRFRWEKVSGKVRKANGVESDYTTLQNLTQYSQCESNEATRKHIYRLNKIFKDGNVPIEIEIKNDKAIRLIIDKS